MSGQGSAHSVLVVPVPELDDHVRARTAHYDPSFLGTEPEFVNAHITVLGPFLPEPSAAQLATVRRILAGFEPFEVTLAEVATFADGLIHLRPEPDRPFRDLTAAMAAAFPECPPYAGAFPDPVPHLTLDQTAPGIDAVRVRRDLSDTLPVRFRADRVDLQWWANHDCRVLASWKIGAGR